MTELFDKGNIKKIRDFLIRRKETIAVAESVTSGLLQAAVASADDASQFFQGGITAYNVGQKSRHLKIEPIHALACNCVSQKIAEEMALKVCHLFNSNWGIGITGYASPVSESDNKLFCFYAVSHNGKLVIKGKQVARKNERLNIQLKYVAHVLEDFVSNLNKL